MKRPLFAAILIALRPLAPAVGAQGAPVTVQGIAFDSIRGAPLANAFVVISGRPGCATTDERGRFRFDSVSPGPHTFTMQHAVLDSVGLSGISARVVVTNGVADVQVAIPSFATLWRSTCGTPPPADSGFIYGTIRDERGDRPVAGATIEATWIDVGVGANSAIRQRG